ncbi:hypothetical protein [Nocardiopsis lambiniae]|uniref:Uncharacterized protein n=1 Tax=Nocardiopsis lambiniae TaxID=3075539 RepID=A0ABU2MGB9_9ACTN|nr:hypothetical protein [Nocardiopsis sp. DSM 44743]MDT0331743.1 hypothetical protein [Nocardiopsis sp. DSM 44743]
MTIDQDPRQLMQRALDFLQDQRLKKADRVASSLDLLGLLSSSLNQNPPPQEELDEFKSTFSSLITNKHNLGGIFSYATTCGIYAERGRLDGFEEACGMRSILQILSDYFIEWDQVEPQNLRNTFIEDLEDIDETLKAVSDDAPPVREEDIPDWAPADHWWWRAPKRQDMSQAEIDDRLHYDWNDGI